MIRGLSENEATTGRLRPADRKPHTESAAVDYNVGGPPRAFVERPAETRRTPRVSVVVVLPENHVVSPDALLKRLHRRDDERIDVLVACAGQPVNLSALQRDVGEAQFLLAPSGTSLEDLREMAMKQATGDIVTLVSGALLKETELPEQQLFKTS
jgi:hypothetical protein